MDSKVQMNNLPNEIWQRILKETWEIISRVSKDLEVFKKYLEEEINAAKNEERPRKIELLLSIIDLNKRLMDQHFKNIKEISSKLVFC